MGTRGLLTRSTHIVPTSHFKKQTRLLVYQDEALNVPIAL